jgi:hypothetical protein
MIYFLWVYWVGKTSNTFFCQTHEEGFEKRQYSISTFYQGDSEHLSLCISPFSWVLRLKSTQWKGKVFSGRQPSGLLTKDDSNMEQSSIYETRVCRSCSITFYIYATLDLLDLKESEAKDSVLWTSSSNDY